MKTDAAKITGMKISSKDIFNHVSNLELENQILAAKLQQKEKDSVDVSCFYNVAMTTEEVAKFHSVPPARVRDYACRGLIELHPSSTDAKMLFRASTVLTKKFDDLKITKLQQKR